MQEQGSYYYSENPEVESQERILDFNFGGKDFKFLSDNGVFSKNQIDMGSRMLLQAFQDLCNERKVDPEFQKLLAGKKLDLGCGYGVIGIVVQKLAQEGAMLLSDINERALELCKKNLTLNAVKNAKALKSDGLENIRGEFSLILSNPPIRTGKEKVQSLIAEAYGHLQDQGLLLIVIGKKQGAASYLKFVESLAGEAQLILKKKGFSVILARK